MRRRVLAALVVLAAAAGAAFWWWSGRDAEAAGRLVASGTVEATDAQLGFEIGGRLATVVPREGEVVQVGDRLAALDATELRARRDQASAQLAAAEARLAELDAGSRPEEIAQAAAKAAAAREQLADAGRDLERARTLVAGGALPVEALDKATSAHTVAEDRLVQAEERLRLLRAGPRREQIAAQRAVVAQARAALASAEATLAKSELQATLAGVVTVRHREPGEIVPPGGAVLTVLDRDDRWVRIYVPEDRVGAVHLGSAATIRADTYPAKDYRGEVVFVASEAEFTPKNVQTREERVRLVYAVKVRVTADPDFELKPGMPVDVTLALPDGEAEAEAP